MPDKDTILQLHSQGLSVGQIAEKLGIAPDVARRVVAQQWADDKDEELMRRRLAGRRDR